MTYVANHEFVLVKTEFFNQNLFEAHSHHPLLEKIKFKKKEDNKWSSLINEIMQTACDFVKKS